MSSPKGSFGLINLQPSYRERYPQKQGANVTVEMNILSILKIDSLAKIVELEIQINLGWEDDRITWTKGPNANQEYQFSHQVIK